MKAPSRVGRSADLIQLMSSSTKPLMVELGCGVLEEVERSAKRGQTVGGRVGDWRSLDGGWVGVHASQVGGWCFQAPWCGEGREAT